jgi:hypothetical protein
MPKYRKKPVVIEARRFDPAQDDATDVLNWCGAYFVEITRGVDEYHQAIREAVSVIRTLEGEMVITPGDFVIRGVQGEFYPCKPDIFEATYEEVNQTEGAAA